MPELTSEELESLPWYHTMDLPGGVTTPGYFDLRKVVDKILPADLTGKRCLDAATASGFFAFEMEKRGASEVVGIDVATTDQRDWQMPWRLQPQENLLPKTFAAVKAALGSKAEHVRCSLYDASPERLGEFDFVFIGSVLIHLRDPVMALRALRTVTAGTLRSYEVQLYWGSKLHPRKPMGRLYEQEDSRWWTPNAAAHRRWMLASGFEIVGSSGMTFQPFGSLIKEQRGLKTLTSPRKLAIGLGENVFGVPSAWFEGRPIPEWS